jgi:para-aminobenzoate synthetase component 1
VTELGPDVRSVFSRPAFLSAVDRIRRYILAGDVFQVNLTQRLSAPLADDPLVFYGRMRRVNPAPFAAHRRPAPDHRRRVTRTLLLAGPDGAVETSPISARAPRPRRPGR